jgi:4-amino-4-deoxy-L-arabinose transferase-like glycosyltransferase
VIKRNIVIAGIVLILLIAVGIIIRSGSRDVAGLGQRDNVQRLAHNLEVGDLEHVGVLRSKVLESAVEAVEPSVLANQVAVRVEAANELREDMALGAVVRDVEVPLNL